MLESCPQSVLVCLISLPFLYSTLGLFFHQFVSLHHLAICWRCTNVTSISVLRCCSLLCRQQFILAFSDRWGRDRVMTSPVTVFFPLLVKNPTYNTHTTTNRPFGFFSDQNQLIPPAGAWVSTAWLLHCCPGGQRPALTGLIGSTGIVFTRPNKQH